MKSAFVKQPIEFWFRMALRQLEFYPGAKSIDPDQPARIAQADLSRYFLHGHETLFLKSTFRMYCALYDTIQV